MSFGKLINEYRLDCGFTYEEIADEVGVTKMTVCNICTGKHLPNVKLAFKIIVLLGILDLNYILYETLED